MSVPDPGRTCPLSYRYRPEDIAAAAPTVADTAYVIGGLYGNIEALAEIQAMRAREEAAGGRVTLVFNGDFNWFNARPGEFRAINEEVLGHLASLGNVEAELAESSGAGCGCAYPPYVDQATVERSNEIMARLQDQAALVPDLRARLAGLPRFLVLAVGEARIGVVHGDPESLAGWGLAVEAMPGGDRGPATPEAVIQSWLQRAGVSVFACSHTCLPFARRFEVDGGRALVINNGSAGMPNFAGDPRGLITRISTRPAPPGVSLYGDRVAGVHCDAVAVDFDQAAWRLRFRAIWPEGSPAYRSYWPRISTGPDFSLERARAGIAAD